MVDATAPAVGHGPLGEERGPAPADVLEDRGPANDVQVRVLLACEGGCRQVLCRRAGADGIGSVLAEPGERAGDRRREIVGDGDRFEGPADLRAERADRLPVVRVQARQLIEPIVDRRRCRHDPSEGVRRHAKARRHLDAVDPRQLPQVRALAADERDLRLVDFVKTHHGLLDHALPPRQPILGPDPGLAASPPTRYTLKGAGSEISLPLSLSSACALVSSCPATPRNPQAPLRHARGLAPSTSGRVLRAPRCGLRPVRRLGAACRWCRGRGPRWR